MKIRSPLLNKLAAKAIVILLRLIFRTVRVTIHHAEPKTVPYEPHEEKFLYAVWHDSLAFPLFCGRLHDTSTLVSRHRDGSLLASAMECLGVGAIRGSSSRGGALAMRQLIDSAKHTHIAITPDGPRGPRRELKSGIVFLASHSQRRILPSAGATSRFWRLKGSWTDLIVPKPFSKVHLVVNHAISVPAGLSKSELQAATEQVNQRMHETQALADRLAAGEVCDVTELSKWIETPNSQKPMAA